jgi:UDP-N-acetylglucosamine 4,6-dehydratase
MITGGTGALGNALVEQFVHMGAERIVIYSRDEHKQMRMAEKFGVNLRGDDSPLRFFLGDVRDKERLSVAMRGVTSVIHAAALKVVPAGEYNPGEFVKTNVMGAQNVIDAALQNEVSHVMGVSTDKACSPVNLYGATKLAAEKIFVAANAYGGETTKFSVCRYGNVTGSTGSVVPFWWNLLLDKATKTLPITNPNMSRFWMTMEDACGFVIESLRTMNGGEVFVPRLPTYYVDSLAHALMENAARDDVGLEVVGVRPGEKVHESMISEDEALWTYVSRDLSKYMITKDHDGEWLKVADGFSLKSDTAEDELYIDDLRSRLASLGWIV